MTDVQGQPAARVVVDNGRSAVLVRHALSGCAGAPQLSEVAAVLHPTGRQGGGPGSIDIMRMREFGVPRYTLFRELLHLKPMRDFDDITDNRAWVRQMREVYEGRIDRVDLMVGMFAEPKPTGFGFSDTAFRIFILMASRRLKSDRFFGNDYTPEVYTPEGMDWIENTSMGDVLTRHYPVGARECSIQTTRFRRGQGRELNKCDEQSYCDALSAAFRAPGSATPLPGGRRGCRRSRRGAPWWCRCSRPRIRACRRPAARPMARRARCGRAPPRARPTPPQCREAAAVRRRRCSSSSCPRRK